ncbi:MAG: hypothetical protein WBF88_11045 [Pusillimonas sp.]
MRERLDCALLSTTCDASQARAWVGAHAGGRLHLHALHDPIDATCASSVRALADAAMRLRRFDACLVPVSPQNLGWLRTALSSASRCMHTPVLALVRELKAGAIDDLYALGLADFIRDPICIEELRARIERLLDARRYNAARVASARQVLGEGATAYSKAGTTATIDEDTIHRTILNRSGTELEAFAIASASRCATTKESFRAAKSQVIERFERAYIKAALGRHSGNIAMAARAAQKHRRAFWALMRKHDIDAAPFRREPNPNPTRDG